MRSATDRKLFLLMMVMLVALAIFGIYLSQRGGQDSEVESSGGRAQPAEVKESPEAVRRRAKTVQQEPSAGEGQGITDDASEAQEPRETEPDAMLRGIVRDPAGKIAPGAFVAIFAMEGEAPAMRAVIDGRSGRDGGFRFKREKLPKGRMLVVAAKRGLRPGWTISASPDAACRRVLELNLETGLSVRGRVTHNGRPDAGRRLSLDKAPGTAGLFFNRSFSWGEDRINEIFWQDGRPELKHASVRVDENGDYEIKGLGPGPHSLTVAEGQGDETHPRLKQLMDEADPAKVRVRQQRLDRHRHFEFDAPDHSADIHRSVATLILRFETDDSTRRAQGRVNVFALSGERRSGTTDFESSDLVTFEVVADAAHRIDITARGFENEGIEIGPLAAGAFEERLVRLRSKDHLELVFQPKGVGVDEVKAIQLELRRLDQTNLSGKTLQAKIHRSTVKKTEAGFVLVDPPLAAGSYEILAEFRGTAHLPIVKTVDLPALGRIEIPLEGVLGARLDLNLVWPTANGSYQVTWRLVSSSGQTLHREKHQLQISENEGFGFGGADHYHEPVVPPGTYELQVDVNGARLQTEKLELKHGQVLRKSVTLKDPKDRK